MNNKYAVLLFICLLLSAGSVRAGEVVQDDSGRKVLYWYDPMVPGTRFDAPGKSPFMDMMLVPKYAQEEAEQEAGQSPIISVTDADVQKMGVRTEKARLTKTESALRATGTVVENERMRFVVSSQVEGRIEDLKFNAVGDPVQKGQSLYSLYSPALYALQADFLAARKAGITDLAEAAQQRLLFLGVDKAVVAGIAKSGKPLEIVPFMAPASGILNRLEVRNGQYIKANDKVAEIQDLAVIWIEAALPEGDLQNVQSGDHAEISFAGDPVPYNAVVEYIYPALSAETRTGKVRLALENKEGRLRPASYAAVSFAAQGTEVLTVPASAILRSSRGDHVLLSLGGGKFQTRAVKTGGTRAGRTEIADGVKEGETVVVSGQFLIDSESNLNEVLDRKTPDQMEGGAHAGH